jgi:hypothetical protein
MDRKYRYLTPIAQTTLKGIGTLNASQKFPLGI